MLKCYTKKKALKRSPNVGGRFLLLLTIDGFTVRAPKLNLEYEGKKYSHVLSPSLPEIDIWGRLTII